MFLLVKHQFHTKLAQTKAFGFIFVLAHEQAETDVAFRFIQSTKQAVSVRWIMHVREKIGFAISPCTEGKMKCKLKFKRISIASSHTLTRKYFGQCATILMPENVAKNDTFVHNILWYFQSKQKPGQSLDVSLFTLYPRDLYSTAVCKCNAYPQKQK